MKILHIEASSTLTESIRRACEGCEIVVVESLSEAHEVLAANLDYDLILVSRAFDLAGSLGEYEIPVIITRDPVAAVQKLAGLSRRSSGQNRSRSTLSFHGLAAMKPYLHCGVLAGT